MGMTKCHCLWEQENRLLRTWEHMQQVCLLASSGDMGNLLRLSVCPILENYWMEGGHPVAAPRAGLTVNMNLMPLGLRSPSTR